MSSAKVTPAFSSLSSAYSLRNPSSEHDVSLFTHSLSDTDSVLYTSTMTNSAFSISEFSLSFIKTTILDQETPMLVSILPSSASVSSHLITVTSSSDTNVAISSHAYTSIDQRTESMTSYQYLSPSTTKSTMSNAHSAEQSIYPTTASSFKERLTTLITEEISLVFSATTEVSTISTIPNFNITADNQIATGKFS